MLSPQETGTIPGAPPGRGKGRETGICRGFPAPAGGAWRRGGRATGRPGTVRLGNQAIRNGEAGQLAELER